MKLNKASVKAIEQKLKGMGNKLQRKAIRSAIDPEAKKIMNAFKSITPSGKRRHKNKYAKREGTGFLKKSFSVRNSGRGTVAGRKIINRAIGYYVFMSPNATGRKGGSKGVYRWGSVPGAKKYQRFWDARQRKTVSSVMTSLTTELGRL